MEVKKRREPATLGDVESLVRDEEDGNQMKSWRTAALAVLCYFGCRRLSNVIRVKDVIIEEDKVIVWMKKQKNHELNEGDSFSMVAVGNGEIHSCDGSQEELCFISQEFEEGSQFGGCYLCSDVSGFRGCQGKVRLGEKSNLALVLLGTWHWFCYSGNCARGDKECGQGSWTVA